MVGGPPTGLLSSQGSAFTGRSCGSLPLQPFLPKKATSQPAVRADASRVGKKEKRAVAASASKSGGSVIDKPEGTQVIERGSNSAANGAPRNGFPVRRIENEGTQVIERGLNGAANGAPRDGSPARRISTRPRVRRRAPKQTSPLDWVGELAFGNPVVKGLQRAAGSTAVALAASLYREAAPWGTDSAEVDYALRGNFLPVPEVGGKVPVRVIEGTVPKGFPDGVYVRNGKLQVRTNLVWHDVGGSMSSNCFGIQRNCLKIECRICSILRASRRRTERLCGFIRKMKTV